MKLCDACQGPIIGKLIVVKMTDDADLVCEECWLAFLDHLEDQINYNKNQESE